MKTQNKIRKIRKLTKWEINQITEVGNACQLMVMMDRKFKNGTLSDDAAQNYQELRDKWFHYPINPDDNF